MVCAAPKSLRLWRGTGRLLFHSRPLAHGGIQDFFADSQRGGGDFQQFVRINEFQGLFQAERLWRRKPQGLIGAGRTGIGELFFLAHIQFNVFSAAILPTTIPE